MMIVHARQAERRFGGPGAVAGGIVGVPLCIMSLALVKVVSLVVRSAQGIGQRLAPRAAAENHASMFAFTGLMIALLAAVANAAIPLSAPVRLTCDLVFAFGFVVMVSAVSKEVAKSARVGLSSDPPRRFETWLIRHLRHSDDAVWGPLVLVVSLLAWPTVIALALPATFGLRTVLMYSAVIWVTATAVTNFEHGDSHYHFFRTHCATGRSNRLLFWCLTFYIEYVFPLALARVPYWYEVQHVVIHHAEDNGPNDTQSTLEYDRASFIDFARCANTFAVSGLVSIDVIGYLVQNRRQKALRQLLLGLLIFYAFIAAVALVNWKCAFVILACRYIAGVMSTTGFFQEHGIINTSDPTNIYTNSLHFIAADNSHGSRGEDFHIAHHLRPAHHWAKYASDVAREMWKYGIEGGVGFLDGPDHVTAYYRLLWKRDFVGLARYFVPLGSKQMTRDEMADLLRQRTRPMGTHRTGPETLDVLLGRGAGYLLP